MSSRIIRRTNARNRSAMLPSRPRKYTAAIITNIESTAADTVRLTFSVRVVAGQLPAFTAGAGESETIASRTVISDTVVELTFTGEVQGTTMIVAEGDPGIRTVAGGFVPAGSYPVPSFP